MRARRVLDGAPMNDAEVAEFRAKTERYLAAVRDLTGGPPPWVLGRGRRRSDQTERTSVRRTIRKPLLPNPTTDICAV
jgi:hypothetical protein